MIPRSPAADAGLRFGDVLTALDGQPLTSSPQLQTVISEAEVDQVVRLRVRRSGSEKVRVGCLWRSLGVSVVGVSQHRAETERLVGAVERGEQSTLNVCFYYL